MLRSITLVDFQSHQRTHLPLGPLTVIVGSSSSGKSAVVRGLRLLAENARGTTYVRQGQKQTRVSAEFGPFDESHPTLVTVTRGKNVSEYELAVPGASEPTVFTKCSTTTPEALVDFMGLGDSSLWVAGQFDRPFLLAETGSSVAQILGKLTNVTMIYAAVRECNRRSSELKRRLNEQTKELGQVKDELRAYSSLPVRLEAGRRAEQSVDRATELFDRRQRLADRIETADDAQGRAVSARQGVRDVPPTERLSKVAARRSSLFAMLREVGEASSRRADVIAGLRQVPETVKLETLITRRATLGAAVSSLSVADEDRTHLQRQHDESVAALSAAKEKFTEALLRAGSCPLCGASAAHAQIDNVV